MMVTELPVWQKLQFHRRDIAGIEISELFQEDKARFQTYSLEAAGLFLDYSKNHLLAQTVELLIKLAKDRHLEQAIEDLFAGKIVNKSEQRPALHTALRYSGADPVMAHGVDVIPSVRQVLTTMSQIAIEIRAGQYLGFSGKPINTILHFGIGGSDLGPLMVFEALSAFVDNRFHYQFFSHQDPDFVRECLAEYNPATTLIIIASKSFTTTETLANAEVAKSWLLEAGQNCSQVARQIIGVTAQLEKAREWGIASEQILPIWDWVGGRYSVWSAMSLIIAIAIGPERFKEFLSGAEQLDRHFNSTPLHQNIPVILGLIDIWYNNFFTISHRAIIPYSRKLRHFSSHLQQVSMESLGKRVTQEGQPIDCATGFVIWGGTGTNSQHSFHQLLLQGNQWSPVDFILPLENQPLVANCLAQSEVLMVGYREGTLSEAQIILGNRPSHTILFPKITPQAIGALLALYEHRIYVCSVIWGINAFDQWGVERGKKIAQQILNELALDRNAQTGEINLLNWIKENL